MPIKDKSRYPDNWKQIRLDILDRASNCCEGSPAYPDCRARNHEPHPVTSSRVVLTVAHLDHTPEHNSPDNLRAWCQRCHLTYDAKHHAANAAKTRRAKQQQKELF